ncbi:hypothetical protein CVT24_000250 [Panaeolus cyanescens]|uniref:Uncharacterized protein n=1 Tax=Panaeolus cyanescens TaxID=181874 RepID=A0A409YD46_9AGAR|nr:hypothetical protein CVT24_000250 [Panaeolus cyanescens]
MNILHLLSFVLAVEVGRVQCAPHTHHRRTLGVLFDPVPQKFQHYYPTGCPLGTFIVQEPPLQKCSHLTLQDRFGDSSIGTLSCRSIQQGQSGQSVGGQTDAWPAQVGLVKVYNNEILRHSTLDGVAGWRPRLRLLWEMQALIDNGLFDRWEYTMSISKTKANPFLDKTDPGPGERMGNIYFYYKNLKSKPLRELLQHPELTKPYTYSTMDKESRLKLLDEMMEVLGREMEKYSKRSPAVASIYNPGLNLGNVYFHFENGKPVVQLPEWAWTQHLVRKGVSNGNPWAIEQKQTYDDRRGKIRKDLAEIFRRARALAAEKDGGLQNGERW